MADKKISALTASSTPLTGTEVLPIVQSGATVKVSIADVTAGRAVSASSLTASTGNFIVSTSGKGITTGSAIPLGLGVNNTLTAMTIDTAGKVGIGNSSPSYTLDVLEGGAGGATVNPIRVYCAAGGASTARIMFGSASNTESAAIGAQTTAGDTGDLTFATDTAGSLTEKMRISSAGNITATAGNLVIGTANKGIDFSANTNAPGMTSEVLTWYETGTWTPNQGSGLTVVGVFSSTGLYTRIGNQVTITGTLSGSGSIALAGPGIIFTNIPYAVAGPACGSMNSSSLNSSGAITAISGTTVYGNTSPAVSTIYFAMTYLV